MVEPKEFWLKKIEEFKKNKNFEERIKYSNKIKELEDARNTPEFWYKKGLGCCEIKEFENALQCFDKDLESNGPNFNTLYQKGIVFYFLKKNSEAIEWFNRALETKYSDYLKTKEQIQTLKKHKEFEKCVIPTQKLKQIDPPPFQFWFYQGLVLAELGKYQESIKCYDEALLIKNDNPQVLFEKAKCELQQGEKTESVKTLKKICELDSSFKEKIQTDPLFSTSIKISQIFE
jgi:tetratricopeptide (TPR) repeat protein